MVEVDAVVGEAEEAEGTRRIRYNNQRVVAFTIM